MYVVSRAHIDSLIEPEHRLPRIGPLRWTDPTGPDPVWPGKGDADRVSENWAACRAQARELNESTTHRAGAMLWAANHRGVSYRYDEGQTTSEFHCVVPRRSPHMDSVAALKTTNCLDYQSCETPNGRGRGLTPSSTRSAMWRSARSPATTKLRGAWRNANVGQP